MSRRESQGRLFKKQYELMDVLGQGGMATVYRAYDRQSERAVAIKIMSSAYADNQEYIDRFLREAQLVERLEHNRILRIFDYGKHLQFFYLVLELLEGGSLSEVIAKKPMAFDRVERILIQIASALDYAHEQKIVHRDLKPSNVLFDKEENVFLMDFGIAKVTDQTMTATGQIMGTPAYMSPEQWKSSRVDHRADIYSCGIMAYEMLTGRTPFTGGSPHQMMFAHLNERLPMISELIPGFPVEVDKVLRKATAKNPQNRFHTASEFALALALAFKSQPQSVEVGGDEERPATLGLSEAEWVDTDEQAASPLQAGINALGNLLQNLEGNERELQVSASQVKHILDSSRKPAEPASEKHQQGAALLDRLLADLEDDSDDEVSSVEIDVQKLFSASKMADGDGKPPSEADLIKKLLTVIEEMPPPDYARMNIKDLLVTGPSQTGKAQAKPPLPSSKQVDEILDKLQSTPSQPPQPTPHLDIADLNNIPRTKGYLGAKVYPAQLQPLMIHRFNQERGLVVIGVEPGSPAELDGVLIGDVLLNLGGQILQNRDDLVAVLNGEIVGKLTSLILLRGGKRQEWEVFLSPFLD